MTILRTDDGHALIGQSVDLGCGRPVVMGDPSRVASVAWHDVTSDGEPIALAWDHRGALVAVDRGPTED